MTYVMSDIHGCYDMYIKMLEEIQFSDSDILYIIGDIIDRGNDGIKLLFDIIEKTNIKLLMGNHEYLMATILSNMKKPIEPSTPINDNMISALELWFVNGGKPTFLEFVNLSPNEQKLLIPFVSNLPLYVELFVNNKDYILVHSGFENFSPTRKLESYTVNELIFGRHDISQSYFNDKIVVIGHTPTFNFGDEHGGRILKTNQMINIDCGCVYPKYGILGCLRLDDLREFYVNSKRALH